MQKFSKVKLWKNVPEKDWNDWHWQIRNRITDVKQLEEVIKLSKQDKAEINMCLAKFKMAISPYYASLMDQNDKKCPVRMQSVPTILETKTAESDMHDPLHEDTDSPVYGITHRYPDRLIFMITDQCSMYCRHCTRRRAVGITDKRISDAQIDKCIEYIRKTKTVRDVVITGGDPLTLEDDVLEGVIKKIRAIKHVEIIRIGTRMPVVLPMRITKKLANMLQKYHPLWVNVHFNHPSEVTKEAAEACDILSREGIPLNNQSVLLKGINDCPHIMKRLVHDLLKIRVRPYYLYQCDLSVGIEHFRTSIGKGIELMERLRGYTSGLAVPTFVIDAPAGGGKVPLMPEYMISRSDKKIIIRNYEGLISAYTEPEKGESSCKKCNLCKNVFKEDNIGIAKLFSGKAVSLRPIDSKRGHEISGTTFHA
ncbi:MAG: lysine 2,3-aminomutase [Candidatus Firestonebacteria bacterium RIFOXYC2_FULL_39_67]|nr:MAG: lysine 2,3-aminomutase [Candidatus Firestonebacteria bacterium RIFOXYD2_FULL_39_29]OGF56144.1 MAG: lysine 2,3-aminomutase [Candidatus Firestonebacteria bacterium RIFOXYC2_FULL_39_67]